MKKLFSLFFVISLFCGNAIANETGIAIEENFLETKQEQIKKEEPTQKESIKKEETIKEKEVIEDEIKEKSTTTSSFSQVVSIPIGPLGSVYLELFGQELNNTEVDRLVKKWNSFILQVCDEMIVKTEENSEENQKPKSKE